MSGSPAAWAARISSASAAAHSGQHKQAALVQGDREGEGLGLPGLAEHWAVRVVRHARDRRGGDRRGVAHAGSRYGSKASNDTDTVGSLSGPHRSRPAKRTV